MRILKDNELITTQPGEEVRTKKQAIAWMVANLNAGNYLAVREVAAVRITEETKTVKKVEQT